MFIPIIGLIFVLNVPLAFQAEETGSDLKNEPLLLTADLYAKLLKERRREHHFVAKEMLKSTYEKNFKLLELAYPQIFKVIGDNNATLTQHDYKPAIDGFPRTDERLQYAVTLVLENCCIAAESLLHFPEISYRIFRKANFVSWKPTLNACITFASALPQHIIDESTVKLMGLLHQEINEELRANTYRNPYYKKAKDAALDDELKTATKSKKKPPKKLKKGPQLSGKRNEL